MEENYFEKLVKIDVSEHMEKKGKFSYLSWSWAVDQLRKAEPSATWEVIRHNGFPYMKTECGYFVEVAVTVQGITLSQIHPVLDNNNRPIAQPNAFQINTSIQRCLVKAIALHGLGLYIYSGEDLPDTGEEEPPKTSQEVGQDRVAQERAKAEERKSNAATGQQGGSTMARVYKLREEMNWGWPDLNQFAADVLGREIKFLKKDVTDESEWKMIEAAILISKNAAS